jgi:hypothetical protein
MNNKKYKQFFLILNGPSCGGKSSVADVIKSKVPKLFNAKQDTIKWLISDYASQKYTEALEEMIHNMIKIALHHKLSVIKEGMRDSVDDLKKIATKAKVPIFFANISPPKETLDARFKIRIEAKKHGAKIGNTNTKRFYELKKFYEDTKVETPLEFNNSLLSSEEIANKIMDYIENNT